MNNRSSETKRFIKDFDVLMKASLCFFLLLIFSLFLFGCGVKDKANESSYGEEIYRPEVSKGFMITGNESEDYTLISVYDPWQGAKEVTSTLLISPSGNKPDGYNGEILKGEPKRIICMSTTHIAMLDALDATDRIVGVSGKQYVSNPYIQNNADIKDIGYEGNINYEALVGTNPDLVLLFSVNGASGMEPKLKELGIPFLYIGDYVEEFPLGKAEWLIPIGEVIGKRELAIEKYQEIKQGYNGLKKLVADSAGGRPKVMVNLPFMDAWFMPSTESYIARMIEDAGGDYIYSKNTGNSSEAIDMEEALKLVSEADCWINIGTMQSKDELTSNYPKFADAGCVVNDKLYNNNVRQSPGGGNDCYESGVVHPDLVLRDMIKIFHPSLIEEDFTYYHRLK